MRASLFMIPLVAFGLIAGSYFVEPATTGLRDFDATNAISARFGQSTSAMYIVRDERLFSVQKLAEMKALTERLRTSGSCRSSLSFFALPTIVSRDDETEVADLVEHMPQTDEEARALQTRALAHPNGKGELLSDDATAALVVCPLIAGKQAPDEPGRVEPLAIMQAVGRDLRLGGILFGLAGLLLLMLVYRGATPPVGSSLVALGVLAFVSSAWWTNPSGTVLGRLLGPGASALLAKLNAVTHADRTLLVSIDADANTADGLHKIQSACDALAPFGSVHCPTAVLQTMAQALTGQATLPTTDEQVRALWFFGGDRPELELVFTADKQHALVRVVQSNTPGDDDDVRAVVARHGATLGGVPLISGADFALPAAVLLVFAFAIAFILNAPAALEPVLGFGALAVPVGLVAWALVLTAVGIGAASALAARRKTRQGPQP